MSLSHCVSLFLSLAVSLSRLCCVYLVWSHSWDQCSGCYYSVNMSCRSSYHQTYKVYSSWPQAPEILSLLLKTYACRSSSHGFLDQKPVDVVHYTVIKKLFGRDLASTLVPLRRSGLPPAVAVPRWWLRPRGMDGWWGKWTLLLSPKPDTETPLPFLYVCLSLHLSFIHTSTR